MFQVLIVDDEPSVLTLLGTTIDWEHLGLCLAATATSGTQALELIKKCHIDIVITDIRMQQINGLELSQILYQNYPHIKIIIMSGYAEFSYAQKALRYGALGYCLKPIETEDIAQLLLKAVGKLRAENKIMAEDDILESIYMDDTEHMLHYLHQHDIDTDSLYLTALTTPLPLPQKYYRGVCIKLSSIQYIYLTNDKTLHNSLSGLQTLFDGCGILLHPVDIHSLRHSIRICQDYAYQYYISADQKLCYGHDGQMSQPFLNQLLTQSSLSQTDDMIQLLKKLQTPDYRKLFSIKGALQIYNTISYSGLLREEDEFTDYYQHLVTRFKTFRAELEYLISQLISFKNDKESVQTISNSSLLELLVYINANFHQDISLQQVAERFGFNSSYLSQAFKKETGVTFTKYITSLRINKAKEILGSTDDPIETVAIKVGYGDYFHFLKTFKKNTGMTPSQYRFGDVSS